MITSTDLKAYPICKGAEKGRWEISVISTGARVNRLRSYATQADATADQDEAARILNAQTASIARGRDEAAAAKVAPVPAGRTTSWTQSDGGVRHAAQPGAVRYDGMGTGSIQLWED